MTGFDVIILGGGPAGMSALLWCHSLELRAVLLETAPALGGQMDAMVHPIFDYPGLPGLNGARMRDQFIAHLQELGLDFQVGCRLEDLDLAGPSLRRNGETLNARALILAAGARKRTLGVPGEDRFALHGVSYSATRDHSLYAGKQVAVIGGGDSAVQNSLILSRICPQVDLIHHSPHFRARPAWFQQAQATDNIKFHAGFEVKSIEGADRVERLVLESVDSGEQKTLETEGVFIRLGVTPNSEMFRGLVEMDEAGYIRVDQRQATSAQNVYAIGDITRPTCFSVASAAGAASIAVKAIALSMKR